MLGERVTEGAAHRAEEVLGIPVPVAVDLLRDVEEAGEDLEAEAVVGERAEDSAPTLGTEVEGEEFHGGGSSKLEV